MSPSLSNTFIIHPNGSEYYVKIKCNVNIRNNTYVIDYKYEFSDIINTSKKKN